MSALIFIKGGGFEAGGVWVGEGSYFTKKISIS